jgi:hypothetical protein
VARAQITLDGELTWQDVWTQAGSDDAGDPTFQTQSIPLGAFADRQFGLRFVYDYTGGRFFPQTDEGVGFYLDEIALSGADEVAGEAVADVPSGRAFTFVASDAGSYGLSVRPRAMNRFLPWGPLKTVSAEGNAGVSLRIHSVRRLGDGQLQIGFTTGNAEPGGFQVQAAAELPGPWTLENGAFIQPGASPSEFEAVIPGGNGPRRFYRVRTE